MSIEAMKQALDALEWEADGWESPPPITTKAIAALRAAIKEAEKQEPVAWMSPSWINPDTRGWASDSFESIEIEGWIPLYTAQRQWQGLTDEDKAGFWRADQMSHEEWEKLFAEIEAKLKEKNNG